MKQTGLFSVIPNAFAFRQGEVELKNMVDTAFLTYATDGRLDEIINRWEEYPGSFYRVAKPYKTPE